MVTRSPEQRVMLIMRTSEAEACGTACRRAGMPFDVAKFDYQREDYSQYHLIVAGSNDMDYWGNKPERKAPEAFNHIEKFVRDGGHLVVFGTYNCRNMEHLRRFGVETNYYHTGKFARIPGISDVLFAQTEDLVPDNDVLKQAGNFRVTTPHVRLLNRGGGYKSDQAAMATIPVDRGRVTFTTAEPDYGPVKGFWLMQVAILWATRGAPVTPGPTDPIVYDRRPPVPSAEQLDAALGKIREHIAGIDTRPTDPQGWIDRAQVFQQAATDEQDLALTYQFLRLAAEAYARAGESDQAVAALDRWTSDFAVPRQAATVSILSLLSESATSARLNSAYRSHALQPIDAAVRSHDFAAARTLIQFATDIAAVTKNRRWSTVAAAETEYVDRAKTAWAEAKPAFEQLATDPQNPQLQRQAGIYQALVVGDWQRGLMWLSSGDDPELKQAAELDRTRPANSADQVRAGDLWVAVAEKLPSAARPGARYRAAYWYSQAISDLTGFDRATVQKKLSALPGPSYSIRIKLNRAPQSTELVITPTQITASSTATTATPERVTLGDYSWTTEPDTPLLNEGYERILPRGVHLSSARVERVSANGTVTVTSSTEQRLVIQLQRTDGKRLTDEFTLTFGP
ncbi:MAG: hypothetical protein ACK5Q5_13160 [Planctomycetaceae bacterium]